MVKFQSTKIPLLKITFTFGGSISINILLIMKNSWWNKVYTPIIIAMVFVAGMSVGRQFLGGKTFYQPQVESKINQVMDFISSEYVDSVDLADMELKTINHIIDELDPHSDYIVPEQYHDVVDPLLGNFDGIGVQFRMIRDTVTVMLPLEGGPSLKAGIKAGDRIVMAGDDTIAGKKLSNAEVMKHLKGPRGSKVTLKIVRSHEKDLLTFDIVRDKIPTYSLDATFMINEKLGYIKISKFSATTIEEFNEAMENLLKQGMSQLVLDLRGNSGGYLRAAIEMSDTFLGDKKLIVFTKGRNRPEKRYYARNNGAFEEGALYVLIDENSASAAEIVAGAIQDNDRGAIIGRKSFGKGLVQEQIDFADGSALRLTVARYYTPTGRCIQRPYEEGKDAYYADHFHRMMDDAEGKTDSTQVVDTTRYITPGGRVLYGGGGIMPDVEIVLDTTKNYYFYNRMVRNSIVVEYAIDYYNSHRVELEKFDNMQQFGNKMVLKENVYSDLVSIAQQQQLKPSKEEIENSKDLIINTLKAELARLLFGEKAYFYIYLQEDEVFNKALQEMNKPLS